MNPENHPKTNLRKIANLALWSLAGAGVGTALLKYNAIKTSGNRHVPQPEKPVDVKRYLGKWYELARYDNRFEHDCEAVTAEYALLPDGRVRVVNSCHLGGVDGKLSIIKGKARIVPGCGNAKLKVSFFGPFYIGNYWVLDRAEDYSWSIVGEPTGVYLWILARDPHPPEWLTNMLFRRAGELGYDTRRLRTTQQKS